MRTTPKYFLRYAKKKALNITNPILESPIREYLPNATKRSASGSNWKLKYEYFNRWKFKNTYLIEIQS